MMPALIPIQIVVDGEQILRSAGEGGTLENPKSLFDIQEGCVFMIANNSYVTNFQATSALNIHAMPGDFVQWRISAVDRRYFSPVLVHYASSHPRVLQNPSQSIVGLPFFIPENPSHPDSGVKQVRVEDVQMTAEVLAIDTTVTYNWTFKLVDRRGSTLGYYDWNPKIKIGNSQFKT